MRWWFRLQRKRSSSASALWPRKRFASARTWWRTRRSSRRTFAAKRSTSRTPPSGAAVPVYKSKSSGVRRTNRRVPFAVVAAEAPSPERSVLAYDARDEHPPEDPVGSVADERGVLEEDLRVRR